MSTDHLDPTVPSRRRALAAMLSAPLAALGLGRAAAKKKHGKKKRCPSRCPNRVACLCNEEFLDCFYIPFPSDGTADPTLACTEACVDHGGVAETIASVVDQGLAAVCVRGGVNQSFCPLV